MPESIIFVLFWLRLLLAERGRRRLDSSLPICKIHQFLHDAEAASMQILRPSWLSEGKFCTFFLGLKMNGPLSFVHSRN